MGGGGVVLMGGGFAYDGSNGWFTAVMAGFRFNHAMLSLFVH